MRKFFIIFLFLLSAVQVQATTYYVGPAATGDESGSDIDNLCTLATANTSMTAGDIANLTEGTYTNGQIEPSNSGTSGNYITYQQYQTDVVTLDDTPGSSDSQAELSNRSYVKIDGIKFQDSKDCWINMTESSDHHIIQNCTFVQDRGDCSGDYYGIRVGTELDSGDDDCDYNQFLNLTFLDSEKSGESIGIINGSYNLVYGCSFGKIAHVALTIMSRGTDEDSKYNVVRSNTFDNEYHSNLSVWTDGDYTLAEDNLIKNAGEACSPTTCNENACGSAGDKAKDRWDHSGHQMASDHCIFRYNRYNNNGKNTFDSWVDTTDKETNYLRFYHNTVYGCYYNVNANQDGHTKDYNHLKNNIFSVGQTKNFAWAKSGGTQTGNIVIENLFYSGDIKFLGTVGLSNIETAYPSIWSDNTEADPKLSDPANDDFLLESDSPAINAATELTQTNGSGSSSTSMVVDDSHYFYTTGSPWNTPGSVMENDTIYIDNPSAADFNVTITAINYSTHTLTLASAKTWDNNADVYYCPDGVCFSGSAPDIGACEYEPGDIKKLGALLWGSIKSIGGVAVGSLKKIGEILTGN